jgi:hypothetical protein
VIYSPKPLASIKSHFIASFNQAKNHVTRKEELTMLEQISKALAVLLKKGAVEIKGEWKEEVSGTLANVLYGLKCEFKVTVLDEATDLIQLFQ